MNNMNSFFSLVILCYGVYCLYLWFTCRKKLPEKSMLVPNEKTMAECVDEEEFKIYILPRLLVFGILVTLFGALGLLDAYLSILEGLNLMVRLLLLSIVPLAAVIWFGACLRRIHKRLWV